MPGSLAVFDSFPTFSARPGETTQVVSYDRNVPATFARRLDEFDFTFQSSSPANAGASGALTFAVSALPLPAPPGRLTRSTVLFRPFPAEK